MSKMSQDDLNKFFEEEASGLKNTQNDEMGIDALIENGENNKNDELHALLSNEIKKRIQSENIAVEKLFDFYIKLIEIKK